MKRGTESSSFIFDCILWLSGCGIELILQLAGSKRFFSFHLSTRSFSTALQGHPQISYRLHNYYKHAVLHRMISLPLLLLGILPASLAHRYALQDETIGNQFFHDFDHEAIDDPTHGRVE